MAGGAGGPVPLAPNAFAFLVNTNWRAEAPPNTAQPQYWVVRVTAVAPPTGTSTSALARLLWLQETAPGSQLYKETRRLVHEPVRSLHPLALHVDQAAGGYRLAGPFDEAGRFAEPVSGGGPMAVR